MSRFAGVGKGSSLPKSSNDTPTFAGASSAVAVIATSEADGTPPCLVDSAKVESVRSLPADWKPDSAVFPSTDGKVCSVPETPSHVAVEFILSKKGETFKRSESFRDGASSVQSSPYTGAAAEEIITPVSVGGMDSGSQEARARSVSVDKSRGRPHNRHRSRQSRSTLVTEQSNPSVGGIEPSTTQDETPKAAEPKQEVQKAAPSVVQRTLPNRNRSRARSRSRSTARVHTRAVSSPPEVSKSSALAVILGFESFQPYALHHI
ncbi:hypothetical protein YC2023_050720 [Brassica napus]